MTKSTGKSKAAADRENTSDRQSPNVESAADEVAGNMFKFTRRTFFRNVGFAEGQVIDLDEYNMDDADAENLEGMGQGVRLSAAEATDQQAIEAVRRQQPTHTPIEDVDVVVSKIRGEDVLYPDYREKGPLTPPIGQRERMVTRLPDNDHPGGTPIAIDQLAQDHAKASLGRKIKVDKLEDRPGRPEDEPTITVPNPDADEQTKKNG